MSKISAQLVALLPGGGRGESFEISGPLIIGRDKTCNIRIKEPSLSRKHAELSLDENGIVSVKITINYYCLLEST
ncbi:FHA domain-containing protein [archaeon]|nr:MAG: FHA domain-containing protein [archaeon]